MFLNFDDPTAAAMRNARSELGLAQR